jgi:hypothetical protein
VIHSKGKLVIPSMMLQNEQKFEELILLVNDRIATRKKLNKSLKNPSKYRFKKPSRQTK